MGKTTAGEIIDSGRQCPKQSRTHALRGAVKVFLSFPGSICQIVQEWCATAVERLEIHGFIIWRALLPTPIADTDPPCMPRRTRLPCAPCPWRVAAGSRREPRRNVVWIQQPTPQTFVAGTADTGGASGPRTSCRCVPSLAQYPHIVGVPRQKCSVPVVDQKPRGGRGGDDTCIRGQRHSALGAGRGASRIYG